MAALTDGFIDLLPQTLYSLLKSWLCHKLNF
jgi:hypothetical protein